VRNPERRSDLFFFPGFIARAVFKQAADGSNVRAMHIVAIFVYSLTA